MLKWPQRITKNTVEFFHNIFLHFCCGLFYCDITLWYYCFSGFIWYIFSYSSELLHRKWSNHLIFIKVALLPLKKSWIMHSADVHNRGDVLLVLRIVTFLLFIFHFGLVCCYSSETSKFIYMIYHMSALISWPQRNGYTLIWSYKTAV